MRYHNSLELVRVAAIIAHDPPDVACAVVEVLVVGVVVGEASEVLVVLDPDVAAAVTEEVEEVVEVVVETLVVAVVAAAGAAIVAAVALV
jgi:hypothetical protein